MAVLTTTYREVLAAFAAGEAPTPPVPAYLAVGTGGTRGGPDDPMPPDPSRTALAAEVLRKPVRYVRREGGVVEVAAEVRGEEVAGALSEAGLLDAWGRLLVYATFRAKALAPGGVLAFRFRVGGENG